MLTDVRPADNASYTGVHGVRTVDPAGAPKYLAEDAVFCIYSMTKLMTSVAAMQCVERGLIGLDDDVSAVLTSWKGAEVLEGIGEDGKPILRKAKKKITLRYVGNGGGGGGCNCVNRWWRMWLGLEWGFEFELGMLANVVCGG